MKKIDLRVVKTKEVLHASLLSLLKEKSLHTISVTEVCRGAKINRGTFYLHYGKVEDLFEEYFKEIMTDLTDSYLEPYKHVQILQTRQLDPSTIRIFHHIEKYKEFYRIVFSKYVPISYYYLLFDLVNDLMKEDLGRRGDGEVDWNLVSAYQSNAVLGMAIEWHRKDFQQTADEMSQILVKILNSNHTE